MNQDCAVHHFGEELALLLSYFPERFDDEKLSLIFDGSPLDLELFISTVTLYRPKMSLRKLDSRQIHKSKISVGAS